MPEIVALFGRDLLEEEEDAAVGAVDAKTKYTRQNRFAKSGLVKSNTTGNKLLANIDALYDQHKPNSGSIQVKTIDLLQRRLKFSMPTISSAH